MTQSDTSPILHICNSQVYGGGEEHVRTILKYLKRLDVPVAAAVPEPSLLFDVLRKEQIPVYPFYASHKFDYSSLKALCGLIRQIRPTIIHTHNRREDLMGALAARLTGVAAVTTIHDRINMDQDGRKIKSVKSSLYHLILRTCFKQIITVSKATYDDIAQYAKVPAQRLHHVINGLDLERVKPKIDKSVMRVKLDIRPEKKIIGFVARIRGSSFGKKGILHLIDAMQMLVHKVPDVQLLVSGEDTAAARILKKTCYEKGVLKQVRFLGYREDIIDIINCCDILVCPSLFEGLPRVVLESMALGVPVVGSNVDGIPEAVDDSSNGYLVEPRDSIGLASALEKLLNDDDMRTQFGNRAKDKIYHQFNAEESARQTKRIYAMITETPA